MARNRVMAERAGFEPAIPFRVYTLSRRAPSTTRTPLQKKAHKEMENMRKDSFVCDFSNLEGFILAGQKLMKVFSSKNFVFLAKK